MKLVIFSVALSWLFIAVSAQSKLVPRFTWNQVDWDFSNTIERDELKASGDYEPQNGLPVGIERWKNKLFVSVPRWKKGVPATLNYINLDESSTSGVRHNVPLKPYLGFEGNRAGDCVNGLSTVYRIKVDRCDRLWVLDVGTIGIGNETEQVCPYSINVFDLNNDIRVAKYTFRKEDTNANTFIANTLVDVGDTCDDAYAYFSDELGYGLIVYSFKENKSWRFEHPFFFPDPLRGDFNIGGINYQWADEGIFGMALGQKKPDGSKTVYFSPLASFREFSVSNKILQNETRVEDSYHEFTALQERDGDGHTTARVIDEKTGIMLYNLIDQNAIGCWNSNTQYKDANLDIVDQDNRTMIFPADVKIDQENNVWVITDRMPNFLITSVDIKDVNYHIFSAPFDDLIKGTKCTESYVEDRFMSVGQKPTLVDILSPLERMPIEEGAGQSPIVPLGPFAALGNVNRPTGQYNGPPPRPQGPPGGLGFGPGNWHGPEGGWHGSGHWHGPGIWHGPHEHCDMRRRN